MGSINDIVVSESLVCNSWLDIAVTENTANLQIFYKETAIAT